MSIFDLFLLDELAPEIIEMACDTVKNESKDKKPPRIKMTYQSANVQCTENNISKTDDFCILNFLDNERESNTLSVTGEENTAE